MILDKNLTFGKALAARADGYVGDTLDMGGAFDPTSDVPWGLGKPLYLHVFVRAAYNNLMSLEVQLRSGSSVANSGNINDSSAQVHARTAAISRAQLVKDAHFIVPVDVSKFERYVQVHVDVAGTAPTTGTIDAYLSLDSDVRNDYKEAQN